MKVKTPKIIIGLLLLIIVAIVSWHFSQGQKGPKKIIIKTDKTEYLKGETLKIHIKNPLKENLCFSSCYPYYLEKKNNSWKPYSYVDCPKKDIIEKCVKPKESKTFETTLPQVKAGLHRLTISACVGCNIGAEFKENKKFFSNEFLVK